MKFSLFTVVVSLFGVLFLSGTVSQAQITLPRNMEISCTQPDPDSQTKLRRPRGDGNLWNFNLVLKDGAKFWKNSKPEWTFPGNIGVNPDWGTWTLNEEATTLSWSAPAESGPFTVTVSGKITCGEGGTGDPIDFSATWSGEIIECDEPTDLAEEDISIVKVDPNFTAQYELSHNDLYGLTRPQFLKIAIMACLGDDDRWHARVLSITGEYSVQVRLRPSVSEITGPPPSGNTTNLNYCKQLYDLNFFGADVVDGDTETKAEWYMIDAVTAHEQVHVLGLLPDLQAVVPDIQSKIEGVSIPDEPGMTRDQAIIAIKNTQDFFQRVEESEDIWFQKAIDKADVDHGENYNGPAYMAEKVVTNPMALSICTYAQAHSWGNCEWCN